MKGLDKQLLEDLTLDRNKAFKEIYVRYFSMVAYLVKQNSGSETDAQDVFQDTLMAMYEQAILKGIKLSCTFKTFIYSIARNLWLKELRKRRSNDKWKDYEKHIEVDFEIEEEQEDERIVHVSTAINKLGEKCRAILMAYYYHNKDMKAIAKEMDYTNADNAKNQKYKCMKQLKVMALELVNNA